MTEEKVAGSALSVCPQGSLEAPGRDSSAPGVLEARGLCYSYPGPSRSFGCDVIREVSFSSTTGERVAICGPSGCGKTTLCRLLAGRIAPRSGTVMLDGRPVAVGTHLLRIGRPASVQLLSQHPEHLFDPRARLIRSFSPRFAAARARGRSASSSEANLVRRFDELARVFDVEADWLQRFPHELSGGQLMRCAAVRALLGNPRFLICDESTAMLDAITQARIWRGLIGLNQRAGLGIVLVSHDGALVERVATRRFVLAEHGRIRPGEAGSGF